MSSSPAAAISNRRKRWSPTSAPLGRKAIALPLDMAQTASFPAFADSLGSALASVWGRATFDHLINNAGHGEFAPLAETREAQFDGLFNVHVKGYFSSSQTLLPLLADGGRIVNFSSGLTRVSYPGFSAYAAAKAAVEMLSVYMARELGGRGITVNTIAPGLSPPILAAGWCGTTRG